MKYIDSHCHIHDAEFYSATNADAAYRRARDADVAMLCVGTSGVSSSQAVDFVADRDGVWAVVGVHPHDTASGWQEIGDLLAAATRNSSHSQKKIVGVGEIGLDYFYMNSPRDIQIQGLEQQLQWSIDYNLPVSFHVRDSQSSELSVWSDFWPILRNFPRVRGVLHSFTDTIDNLERGLSVGLCIGVNGIATFSKGQEQQAMYRSIPLEKIILETDAPFLTPSPFRGKINEPSYVVRVAEHVATLNEVSVAAVAATTTDTARRLFDI